MPEMPAASAPRRARFNIGGRGRVPTAREGCAVTSPMIQTCRVNCDEAAGTCWRRNTDSRASRASCARWIDAGALARSGDGRENAPMVPAPYCLPHQMRPAPCIGCSKLAARCGAEVVPPYFLPHQTRPAPCVGCNKVRRGSGPTLFFITRDAHRTLLSWK